MSVLSPKFGLKVATAPCHRVVTRRPHEAVGEQSIIDLNWEKEGWKGKPEFCRLGKEHFELARMIQAREGQVRYLSSEWVVSMNSMMVRDCAVICPDGSAIQAQVKTVNRLGETDEVCQYLEQLGLNIAGSVSPDSLARGSDFVLLDHDIYVCGETSGTCKAGRDEVKKLLLANNPHIRFIDCDGLKDRHAAILKEELPGYMSDRLCCALSPVKEKVVVACSAVLGEDTINAIKKAGIEVIDVTPKAWSMGAADILSLSPEMVCMRRTSDKDEDNDPLLKDVAHTLEKLNLIVNTFQLNELPLSGSVLNPFVLPYSRC